MYKIIYLLLLLLCCKVMAQKDTLVVQKLLDDAYALETNAPSKALQTYQKSYQLSLKNNYAIGAFKSLQYSGIVHSALGNYDSAIFYYQKSKPFAIKAKYPRGEAQTYINIGNSCQFKGDYKKAIEWYIKGIPIFEKIKDSAALSQSYQNLSAMYNTIVNNDLELFYLKKALQFSDATNIEQLGLLYGDVGLTYLRQNKLKEGLVYIKKTEALTKKSDSKVLLFFAKRNLGEYYYQIKEYKTAIPYYEEALLLVNFQNDAFQKTDLYYILCRIHLDSKNLDKSLFYGNEALKLARKTKNKKKIYQTLERLSEVYKQMKQPEKAFDYLSKSYALKDSLQQEEFSKNIALTQTQFETKNKDKSIAEQQLKLKKQELDLLKNQRQSQIYSVIGLLAILGAVGVWFFYRQRQRIKNKEITSLKQQQEITKLEALIDGEEKERRRVAQELHDGINGDLSAIKYKLSSIENTGLGTTDIENLKNSIEMIDQSCVQVRNISHNLMPASIVDYGLVETTREYCSKIDSTHPIDLSFQSFGNPLMVSKKNETIIYRIIQELINNVLKHSKATEAMVQLNFKEDELFITVEDNGIGFDKNTLSKGIGLKNIETRANFLNATLEIESTSKGTSVHISIDLNTIK